ncbi:MAG: flagellar hook-basal body complex protein FliE [Mahellales bacterium]|jgi:flagellar hook-basal body complex protein FliE
MNIESITGQAGPRINNTVNKKSGSGTFEQLLTQGLEKVNQLQKESDSSNILLASGQIDSIHRVMIDAEKANIALQFTVQIRNKIIDAYNEIMRMQI